MTLTSPRMKELSVAITAAQDELTAVQKDADAEVNRLSEQIRATEKAAAQRIEKLNAQLGELRGAEYTEHRRLVDAACNACVIEANELACSVDAARDVHDVLRERIALAVRGTCRNDWAEEITDTLEHRQQYGGFTYFSLKSVENRENGRFLTDKQADRVWEVLSESCTDRGTDDRGNEILGTPYPIYRTEAGVIVARLS